MRTYLKQSFERIEILEKHLRDLQKKSEAMTGKVSPKAMEPWLEKFPTYLEHLETKLEKLGTSINDLHSTEQQQLCDSQPQKDGFCIEYIVKRNGGNVYLDFEDKTSPDSNLKEAIFSEDSRTVSAVANGIGGVGKNVPYGALL